MNHEGLKPGRRAARSCAPPVYSSLSIIWLLLTRRLVLFAMVATALLSPQLNLALEAPLNDPIPLRVYVALDDTWSMTRRARGVSRMHYATAAAERWLAALELRPSLTIQLVRASDGVEPTGTFALRSEADRAVLIEAIRAVKPRRNTRTSFTAIDRELAATVRRDTAAGEDFGVLLLSDLRSDEPANDLRAQEIGDRTINVGGGVSAVMLGTVPAEHGLASRGVPKESVPASRSGGASSSALRTLRQGLIHLNGNTAVSGTMRARLFGGWSPLSTEIQVENTADIPRLVRFEVVVPIGVTANVLPNPLILAAGGSATAQVELAALEPVQGEFTVIANLPDGRSARHSAYVQLTPGGWITGNVWILAPILFVAVLILSLLTRWMNRTVRVGDHVHLDRQASLAIGDTVALDTFAPGTTGALRRGWLGYQIVADGQPVAVSGRSIPANGRGRYRFGEDVRVGDHTFAIFRTDTTPPGMSVDDFSFAPLNGRGGGELR